MMGIKKPPAYVHPNKKKGDEENVTKSCLVRLVVSPPMSGQFNIYDRMIESGLSPKQVLLGLLKRGFVTFKADLFAGKLRVVDQPYVKNGAAIETTRSVDAKFIAKARAAFDEFGVLTDRAVGQKIGEAIIQMAMKEDANGG